MQSFKLWAFEWISVCWCLQTVVIQPTSVPAWLLSMSELGEWSVWEIRRGKAVSALLERECYIALPLHWLQFFLSVFVWQSTCFSDKNVSLLCVPAERKNTGMSRKILSLCSPRAAAELCVGAEGMNVDRWLCEVWNHGHLQQSDQVAQGRMSLELSEKYVKPCSEQERRGS